MSGKLPDQIPPELVAKIKGPKPPLPEPWCDAMCPRQRTHMWTDCECGGAGREFEHYREIHRRAHR